MKVGIIGPTNYLELCVGDLYLCYASLLNRRTYLDFYKDKEVILDTSPKLPRSPSITTLIEGVKLIEPSMVILPSIDYSAERTISLHKDFVRYFGNEHPKWIGVLQGSGLDSLVECYREIRNLCEVIALPSPLESIARRDEIIRDVGISETTFYLEVYKNPLEEIPTGNSLGICTSFPVRLAVALREIYEFMPTPPTLNFNLPKDELDIDLLVSNISSYRSIVQEGVVV